MEAWRLGRRPALDGLRAVAVLLVVACHGLMPGIPGAGATGVAIFFTLSGFLITSLLLDDRERQGSIRFGRFYARRARRLFPALAALVVAVLAAGRFVGGAVHSATVLGTVFYANNIVLAHGHLYPGDWLGHTWSLSIEEQFYLLWPVALVLLARLERRTMLGVTAGLVLGSMVLRFSLWPAGAVDDWRIYFGLETRADGLLLGCLVAMVMREVRIERSRPWLALVGFGLIMVTLPMQSYRAFVVSPTLTTIGTALVIFGVAQGQGFAPLEGRVLGWLGRRSYGIYLWHYPVAMTLRFHTELHWWQISAVLLPTSLALAAMSWRYVEEPFLSGRAGAVGLRDREEEGGRLAMSDLRPQYAAGRGVRRAS